MNKAEALIVVNDPDTHLTTLHGLRKHEDAEIRTAVAQHPNTCDVSLRQLIHDEDPNVLLAVHKNSKAHPLHRTIAGWNYANLMKETKVS